MSSSDEDRNPSLPRLDTIELEPNSPQIPASAPPSSPRKRRRSSSVGSTRDNKRAWRTSYNDDYRLLFNHTVHEITGAHVNDLSAQTRQGKSAWTARENEAFFTAVERLGKDNLPGIVKAVQTKSMPEIRQHLLLLQDALLEHTNTPYSSRFNIALQDIPAASEIGLNCEIQLEATADGLALRQERFEAQEEQDRYGKHWLMNEELADRIEAAFRASRAGTDQEADNDHVYKADRTVEAENIPPVDEAFASSLLRDIPEAKLLIPKSFLELSHNVFMNQATSSSHPWKPWTELYSEFASEPSMYRTAFRDMHTVVLSVTKRVVQTALFQATSRIRSQGWRGKKGVSVFVKSRDVHTALDLMGLKKSKREYWRDLPRRCRLAVFDGKWRKKRNLSWDETEHILDWTEGRATLRGSDTEPDFEEEEDNFKSRAIRRGTPLPSFGRVEEDDTDDQSDASMYAGSDVESQSELGSEVLSLQDEEENPIDSSPDELETLEQFDQAFSQKEERRLWSILKSASPEPKADPDACAPKVVRKKSEIVEDWRDWTNYHADWENFRAPVSSTSFLANRKSPSAGPAWTSDEDQQSDYGSDTGRSARGQVSRRNSLSPPGQELPLRDARTYAAMQGRHSVSEEREMDSDASQDEANIPTLSIE